eukprot:Nk52_evm1s1858 gene=Nk52_evmTU1s1858
MRVGKEDYRGITYLGEIKQRELSVRKREPELGDERFVNIVNELKKTVPELFVIPEHGFSRESILPAFRLQPKPEAKFKTTKPAG